MQRVQFMEFKAKGLAQSKARHLLATPLPFYIEFRLICGARKRRIMATDVTGGIFRRQLSLLRARELYSSRLSGWIGPQAPCYEIVTLAWNGGTSILEAFWYGYPVGNASAVIRRNSGLRSFRRRKTARQKYEI